jgi:hypothetical protein
LLKAVFIVGMIAASAWWFWGRTLEPAKVVQAQLEAIARHDYQTAYNLLSDNAKTRVSPGQFTELVQHNPVVDNNYTSEFLDRRIESNIARFSGTVRALGRESTPAAFTVVKQDGRWVIEEFHF